MKPDEAIRRFIAEQHDCCAAYRNALARRLDLDSDEAGVVFHVALKGRATAEELSVALVRSADETAVVLDGLVAREVLVRSGPAGIDFDLTPPAREELNAAADPLLSDLDAIMARLSAHERSVIGRFLEDMVAVRERRADELVRRAIDRGDRRDSD
jgi:hypothetical protein